jgi:hypothetical protein
MQLIIAPKHECTYACLSMLLGSNMAHFRISFNKLWDEKYPFDPPYDELPRVPSMDEICFYMAENTKGSLMPFNRETYCTPSYDQRGVRIWSDKFFYYNVLPLGPGLIEGMVTGADGVIGHMVAWNGSVVYDPRGYCYSINVADKFGFQPKTFWLKR